MRIEEQLINKILNSGLEGYFESGGSLEILDTNKEELKFILKHHEEYGNIVDLTTFRRKFPRFEVGEVNETIPYLIHALKEQKNFGTLKQLLEEVSKISVEDSFEATRLLKSRLNYLKGEDNIQAIDIIHDTSRGEEYQHRLDSGVSPFVSTGLPELDSIIGGYNKQGEELVVVVARSGHGKSFYLVKTVHSAWESGLRVGFVSPEMTPSRIGYRFDTIHKGISNRALLSGFGIPDYQDYLQELKKNETPYFVTTPRMLGGRVTVSKLRELCLDKELDFLAVDGITYLRDERQRSGDSDHQSLTNISEDLFQLSLELQIPIVVVVQANREASAEGVTTPDLSHVRGSDGIVHNATKVIGLGKRDTILEVGIKKNRDGESGGYVKYNFLPDRGEYSYLPDDFDSVNSKLKQESMTAIQKEFEGHDIEF